MKTLLLLIKIKPELLPRLKIASLVFAEKSRQKLKRIIIIIISLALFSIYNKKNNKAFFITCIYSSR